MSAQPDLFAYKPLGRQNAAVLRVMARRWPRTEWWTLPALRDQLSDMGIPISEAGLSARIRDLRKPQYGGHTIVRRKNGSLWEYRLCR